MKKNENHTNADERKTKNPQQDSSFNIDDMEDVPPYEPYDKNRIDTTNL